MNQQEIYDQHHADLLESESVQAGIFDKWEYESMADYLHAKATKLTEQALFYGVDE